MTYSAAVPHFAWAEVHVVGAEAPTHKTAVLCGSGLYPDKIRCHIYERQYLVKLHPKSERPQEAPREFNEPSPGRARDCATRLLPPYQLQGRQTFFESHRQRRWSTLLQLTVITATYRYHFDWHNHAIGKRPPGSKALRGSLSLVTKDTLPRRPRC